MTTQSLATQEAAEVVEAVPVRPLEELGRIIVERHAAAELALAAWLDHAVAIGRALMEARPQVPFGTWQAWYTR